MMGNLEHAGVIPLTLVELFEVIKGDEEMDYRLSMQYSARTIARPPLDR